MENAGNFLPNRVVMFAAAHDCTGSDALNHIVTETASTSRACA